MASTRQFDEFKPFLDAVVVSGERTRRVIYVLLLMLTFDVAFFTEFTYPDWNGTRTVLRAEALNCYEQALGKRSDRTLRMKDVDCTKRLMLMANLHYPLVELDYSKLEDENFLADLWKYRCHWDWISLLGCKSGYSTFPATAPNGALPYLETTDPLVDL